MVSCFISKEGIKLNHLTDKYNILHRKEKKKEFGTVNINVFFFFLRNQVKQSSVLVELREKGLSPTTLRPSQDKSRSGKDLFSEIGE